MASSVENQNTFGIKLVTCETSLKIEHAQLLFKSKSTSEVYFRSAEFNSGPKDKNRWYFSVSLRSESVFITVGNTEGNERATVSVSILDLDKCKRHTKTVSDFIFIHSFSEITVCHIGDFITYQQLLTDPKLLPGGDLIIHCEIMVVKKYPEVESSSKFQIPTNSIENDSAAFLETKQLSDVVLAVGGKEINAHKVILGIRSPVFAAMFESDMKETRQNRVIVTDLDYEVVQEMLRFIYTGKSPNISTMAERLLMAADKYSLDALKAMCEQELYKTISMDTVAELIAIADRHNAVQLKNRASEFIATQLSEITRRYPVAKLISNPSFYLMCKEMCKLNGNLK